MLIHQRRLTSCVVHTEEVFTTVAPNCTIWLSLFGDGRLGSHLAERKHDGCGKGRMKRDKTGN